MNHILKSAVAVMCLAAFSSQVFAQTEGGEEALGFSRITRNPQGAAMGFSGAASSSTAAWSSFGNSAVLPFYAGKMDIQAVYQSWAPDNDALKTTNIAAGFSYKFGKKFGMSLGFVSQKDAEEYLVYNESGATKGSFTPSDMQLNIGAGLKIGKSYSIGANIKYLNSKLSEDDSYGTVAADIFVMGKFSNFNVAFGASNVGGSVKDANDKSFKIPSSMTLAGNYSTVLNKAHGFDVNLDADYYFTNNMTVAVGAQYAYDDMVFVRAGYHYGNKEAILPSFATLGAGVKFFGFRLDFAYLLGEDTLKGGMTIGLGYSF
ncbi:MAG: PorV/PorQ family protein [Bacteroidales bacterium]